MADKQKSFIELLLSQPSKRDMNKLLKDLGDADEKVLQLVNNFKQLSNLISASKFNAVAGARGGVNSYLEGQRFRESRKADQTASLGTKAGKQAYFERELVKNLNEQVRHSLKIQKVREAIAMNSTRELKNLHQITDIKTLEHKKDLAALRMQYAKTEQTKYQVTQARKLHQEIEKRIAALKEEQRQAKNLTDEQRAAQGRRLTMQRLFGDGGASLFTIQAGILANFMLMNQLQGGAQAAGQFVVELDRDLKNLQAIVRVTDTDMQGLRDSLIGVSEATKFTAVEVANAAVTLGQAGLSVNQIKSSVSAISLLATATGTELDRAVDIATSTLGVFNMESAQMASVAHTLTEAVNSSKLNIEKLTLGLQYSGNIAAQSGVRFEELTAALGAMANAGIRSGSTLGTGMRQILITLQKPSEQFLDALDRLGLTMDDVDIRANGLYGALANLKAAGFTAADAVKSFEVRAAAAYNALSGNLDQMLELEDAFSRTTAATKANEVQMESLANQGRRFASVLGSVVAVGLEPIVVLLRDVIKGLGDFFSWLKQFEAPLQILTTLVVGLGTAFIAWRLASLVKGLKEFVFGTAAANTVLGLFTRNAMRATVASLSFKAAITFFTGPVGIAVAAITAGVTALTLFRSGIFSSTKALEAAQTTYDRSVGTVEKFDGQISNVNGKLQELKDRYDVLRQGGRLLDSTILQVKQQFWDMGKNVTNVGTTVDELIESLRNLRSELADDYVINLKLSKAALQNLITATEQTRQQELQTANSQLTNRYTRLGVGPLATAQTSPNLLSLIRQGVQIGTGTDQTAGILAELKSAQNTLVGAQLNGRLNSQQSWDLGVLEWAIPVIERSLSHLQEIERLQVKEKAVDRQTLRGQDIQGSQFIRSENQASLLRSRANPRMANAINSQNSDDPRVLHQAAVAEAEQIRREGERILKQANTLWQLGLIQSQETMQTIEQLLAEANGEAQRRVNELAEEAASARETFTVNQVDRLKKEVETLNDQIENAPTGSQAGTYNRAVINRLRLIRDAKLAEISQMDIPTFERQQLEAAIRGEYREGVMESSSLVTERIEELREGAREVREEVLNAEISSLQIDLERYREALENASSESALQDAAVDVERTMAEIRDRELALINLSDLNQTAKNLEVDARWKEFQSDFLGLYNDIGDKLEEFSEAARETRREILQSEVDALRVDLQGYRNALNDAGSEQALEEAAADVERTMTEIRDRELALIGLSDMSQTVKDLEVDTRWKEFQSDFLDLYDNIGIKLEEFSEAARETRREVLQNEIDSLNVDLERSQGALNEATSEPALQKAAAEVERTLIALRDRQLALIGLSDASPEGKASQSDIQWKRFQGSLEALYDQIGEKLEQIDQSFMAAVRAHTMRFEQLREMEEARRDILKVIETGTEDQKRQAQAALFNLNEEERELRNIDGRLSEMTEKLSEFREMAAQLPFDERMQARKAAQEIYTAIQEAWEAGEDLSEVDLSNLENQFKGLWEWVNKLVDGTGRLTTSLNNPWANHYYRMTTPDAAEKYKSKQRNDALREAAATSILDLIAVSEGTEAHPGARGYNTTLDYGKWLDGTKWGKRPDLVKMTLSEIMEMQGAMLANPENQATYVGPNGERGSSAVGRYQIVRTTLRDHMAKLGLDPNTTLFDQQTQDMLASSILREQGVGAWEGMKTVNPQLVDQALGLGFDNPTGPSGNERASMAFQELMTMFRTQLGRFDIGVDANSFGPQTGIDGITGMLDKVKEAMNERARLIEEMSANTGRTKEEQERLNQLVEEHRELSRFVEGAEARILEIKKEHKLLQFDLNKSVQDWADANLNMAQVMETGLGNVLSGLTDGFATLFSELTEKPKQAGEAFRQFGITVLKALQQVIARMLAVYVMQKLIGMVFPSADVASTSLAGIARSAVGLPIGAATGGRVLRKAGGGDVVNGTQNRDSVPHLLMPGEYVMRKSAVDAIGIEQLDRMNAMGNRKAAGGLSGIAANAGKGPAGNMNVYVVSPDQKPVPGPQDIIVAVADDLQRGGPLKRLVKSVSMGEF